MAGLLNAEGLPGPAGLAASRKLEGIKRGAGWGVLHRPTKGLRLAHLEGACFELPARTSLRIPSLTLKTLSIW